MDQMQMQNQNMGMRKARTMATEFVTDGHPDKVCDQIADAIVDAALAEDSKSHVAMEVTGGHGGVVDPAEAPPLQRQHEHERGGEGGEALHGVAPFRWQSQPHGR